MGIPESQQDMVWGDGDPLRSFEDERSIIYFLCDHVQPGVKFFVIHLELVGADDGLAGGVLDDSNNSLNSSNSFMMLGESSSEFYGGEFDVEL